MFGIGQCVCDFDGSVNLSFHRVTDGTLLLLQFRVDGRVLRPQLRLQAAGRIQGALRVACRPALGRFGIGEQFGNRIGSLRAQLAKTLSGDVTVIGCARFQFG